MALRPPRVPRVSGPRVSGPRVTTPRVGASGVRGPRVTAPRVTGPRVSGGGFLSRLFRRRPARRRDSTPPAGTHPAASSTASSATSSTTSALTAPQDTDRSRPVAAAPQRQPQGSVPARAAGELIASLHVLGKAQWGADFDPSGLDQRFLPYFDQQQRLVLRLTRPDGRSQRVVGLVDVEGFDPDGEAVSFHDSVRLARRPTFRLRRSGRREAVTLDGTVVIEAVERPNGRFRWVGPATPGSVEAAQ